MMYIWVSTPLTILMEEVWRRHLNPLLRMRHRPYEVHRSTPVASSSSSSSSSSSRPSRSRRQPTITRTGLVPDPQWIEFMAVLERCLNFCHTGNAICLSQGLMRRTSTTNALLEGYMPIFLGVLCIGSQSNIAPIIRLESWPTDKNGFPLVASKRAQTLTYGDAHWQVCPSPLLFLLPSHVHLLSSSPSDSNFLFFSFQRYLAYFQIKHRLALSTKGLQDPGRRLDFVCHTIGDIIAETYIQDVTDLVREDLKAIKKHAKKWPQYYDDAWLRTRWTSFKRWSKDPFRLDYGDDHSNLTLLSRTLADDENEHTGLLPQATEKRISTQEFAARLYKIGITELRQSVVAPVSRTGATWHVLHIAIAEATKALGTMVPDDQKAKYLTNAILNGVIQKKIHFFPNKPGTGSSAPSPQHWTYLGKAPTQEEIANTNVESLVTQQRRQQQRAAADVVAEDTTTEWRIMDLTIEDYGRNMTQNTKPADWDYSLAGGMQDTKGMVQVYEWAAERMTYPQNDWTTRLAMTLGFLMAKVMPTVFSTEATKTKEYPITQVVIDQLGRLDRATAHMSISLARQLPWIAKKDRNGIRDSALYFTQASVVVLGWIHPDSAIIRWQS